MENNLLDTLYSSFHFLFHYPYITPIYYVIISMYGEQGHHVLKALNPQPFALNLCSGLNLAMLPQPCKWQNQQGHHVRDVPGASAGRSAWANLRENHCRSQSWN